MITRHAKNPKTTRRQPAAARVGAKDDDMVTLIRNRKTPIKDRISAAVAMMRTDPKVARPLLEEISAEPRLSSKLRVRVYRALQRQPAPAPQPAVAQKDEKWLGDWLDKLSVSVERRNGARRWAECGVMPNAVVTLCNRFADEDGAEVVAYSDDPEINHEARHDRR
jgi:hypothetical protein